MQAFPFQSNYLGDDEQGNPQYDRAVGAEFFRDMWRLFFTDGIFANPSTNFQVLIDQGLKLKVLPGTCFIKGVTGIEIENTPLIISNPSDVADRTDIVVIRVDFTQNRSLTIEVKTGTTTLRRDADIWELQLARINVRRNTQSILQSDITDTRLNSSVCGVVTCTINQVDTTTIFNQYMDYWNNQRIANENAWQAQMTSQENRFIQQKNTIDAWYASVITDIALLKTFDFDNISELIGSKKDTVFNANGSITEVILISASNKKVADRTSIFNANGTITVDLKVYADDGISILKHSSILTTFNPDGSITEVVS